MANHWLRTRVQLLRAPPLSIFRHGHKTCPKSFSECPPRVARIPSISRPGRGGGSRLGPSPVGPESFHLGGRAPLFFYLPDPFIMLGAGGGRTRPVVTRSFVGGGGGRFLLGPLPERWVPCRRARAAAMRAMRRTAAGRGSFGPAGWMCVCVWHAPHARRQAWCVRRRVVPSAAAAADNGWATVLRGDGCPQVRMHGVALKRGVAHGAACVSARSPLSDMSTYF